MCPRSFGDSRAQGIIKIGATVGVTLHSAIDDEGCKGWIPAICMGYEAWHPTSEDMEWPDEYEPTGPVCGAENGLDVLTAARWS